jgi:hypothetical protein
VSLSCTLNFKSRKNRMSLRDTSPPWSGDTPPVPFYYTMPSLEFTNAAVLSNHLSRCDISRLLPNLLILNVGMPHSGRDPVFLVL